MAQQEEFCVVTGCSGYIATELTAQLLRKGYTVRGTVRDPSNKTKVAHLLALGEALPGKLTLHAADLLKDGSFDEVVKGASVVYHTASPVILKEADAMRDLVEPALHGTTTVMRAVAKSRDSVRRVVLTASVASIMKLKSGPSDKALGLFTDEDWNTDATLESSAYAVSKVRAERAAWEIAEKHGISLTTIHPAYVCGPVTSARTDAFSINTAKDFLEGRTNDPNPFTSFVDVRDVAAAHILAAELPEAKGRYILAYPEAVQRTEIAEALRAAFPAYAFPEAEHKADLKATFDSSKTTRELGLQWTHPRVSYVDMARTLFSVGVAKPVPK